MDLSAWLRSLGLDQYEQTVSRQCHRAGHSAAAHLGVSLIGHRHKLLDAIALLRAADTSAAEDPREQPPTSVTPADRIGKRRQVTVLLADLAGYITCGDL